MLPTDVLQLLNRSDTIKILGVYDSDGNLDLMPFAIVKAPKPDQILLPQIEERGIRDDLIRAMERRQPVSILCMDHLQGGGRGYQILCMVREYQTTGPLYEKFVDELRISYATLQGVWTLEPLTVKERF